MDVEVVVSDYKTMDFSNNDVAGVLFQYPNTEGCVNPHAETVHRAHSGGVSLIKDRINKGQFLKEDVS